MEQGELKSLADLGISETSVRPHNAIDNRGECLTRSDFVQNGQQHVSEDVWFSEQ